MQHEDEMLDVQSVADLEHYIRTHHTTAPSSQNGKKVKHITPEAVEPTEEPWQEEFDGATGSRDDTSGSLLKEQARSLGAQSAKLRKQAAQLEIEQKLLEIEKQRLALRMEDLSRIDQALAITDRLVNILQPEQSRSLESALSVLKRDAQVETTATN